MTKQSTWSATARRPRRGARSAAALSLIVAAIALGSPSDRAAAAPGDFTVSPTNIDFGAVTVGDTSAPIDVVVTNISAVTQDPGIGGGAASPTTEFGSFTTCTAPLDSGESCTINYTFHPTSAGTHDGATTITIDTEFFPITLTGTGVSPFTVTPTDIDFGDGFVGDTSPGIDVVITNVGPTTQSPAFGGGSVGGDDFSSTTNCSVVGPGESCTYTYVFHPAALGARTDNSSVIVIGTETFPITLTGNGTFPFTATPTDLDFGDIAVGTSSSPVDIVITNIGTTPQDPVFSPAPLVSSEFSMSSDCPMVVLAPGESCVASYVLTPTAAGAKNASTEFYLNATAISSPGQVVFVNSLFPVTLAGNGVDPAAPTSSTTTADPGATTVQPTSTTNQAATTSSAPTTAAGSNGGVLPATGSAIFGSAAGVAALLVVLGVGTVLATRRRRVEP